MKFQSHSLGNNGLFKSFASFTDIPIYIFYFIVCGKKQKFVHNKSRITHFNTRFNEDLHPPICNLTLFQRGVQFSGIKLFYHLPPNIKRISSDINLFRPALYRFLLSHSFYSLKEYFDYKHDNMIMVKFKKFSTPIYCLTTISD